MKIAILFVALFCFANVAFASRHSKHHHGGWRFAEANPLNQTEPTGEIYSKRGSPEITFYNGEDLKNAACYGQRGLQVYNARPTDMIAAMWMRGLEKCFKCIEIRNNRRTAKSIVVKVIDKCGGCPAGGNNVDLTESAFKKLASLNEGRVQIAWRPLQNCPKTGSWPTFEERRRR